MSLQDVRSSRSSPSPEACPECDTSASVTSDLHKYQVACTCKPASVQYACADDPGPPPPAKTDTPPALPPRPPTSSLAASSRRNANLPPSSGVEAASCGRRRKYAWWCVGCGALAAALGGLLAAAHILLRAYTASPHHLETVPAAVPAAMLVLTGVCIMSLARRRNRYSYMIKVVGACCLVCALTCVLVTITTTVIHMNKLQTLKFCEYTKLTRTCTCYSMPPDSQHAQNDEGVRCVFEGVTDCGVVHGVLYWCLRGVFALSVTAVLVCIFSCMLAYQLLSHERKKMYWEQLELRCRSLYRPPVGHTMPAAGRPVQSTCSCCTQCHPSQPAWDISLQHRFWAPGRIGNLYSPNPGSGRKNSAWSWFPWPRNSSHNSRCRMGVPQSGDSAYGFCDDNPANPNQVQNQPYEERTYPSNFVQNFPRTQNQGFAQNSTRNFSQSEFGEGSGNFDSQTGVWGPPPPYSPQGRSGSRHHLHQPDPATATLLHHHHIDHRNSMITHDHPSHNMESHTCNRNSSYIPHLIPNDINPELLRLNPDLVRLNPDLVRLNPDLVRLNPEYQQELVRMQELSHLNGERFNTLRGHLVPYPCQSTLALSMGNIHRDCRLADENMTIECLHQKTASKASDQSSDSCQKLGKENLGFQNDKHGPLRASMQDCHRNHQNAESEVYFADVSSCCNVSVKADCCVNQSVSALVGTIENHPESTSESDTGSFTLTRQQRPQPQAMGTKRRTRNVPKNEKQRLEMELNSQHSPIRMTDLNNHSRMNDSINSNNHRMSDIRMCEANHSRLSDRMNDSRICDSNHRMNDSNHLRMSDRMHDSNHSRLIDRMNEANHSRLSDRMNESNHSRLNESNHSRFSDRMNDANHSRLSDRMNDSNHSRLSDRMIDSRMCDPNHSRLNDRMNELNNSKRMEIEHIRHMHPRQSSLDSNNSRKTSPEFFVPPPPNHSPLTPLTPNTEESAISDEEQVEKPEASKCLGPDSQYDAKDLKPNHHHSYSDTNTMDSGWQSGSEKHVTD